MKNELSNRDFFSILACTDFASYRRKKSAGLMMNPSARILSSLNHVFQLIIASISILLYLLKSALSITKIQNENYNLCSKLNGLFVGHIFWSDSILYSWSITTKLHNLLLQTYRHVSFNMVQLLMIVCYLVQIPIE